MYGRRVIAYFSRATEVLTATMQTQTLGDSIHRDKKLRTRKTLRQGRRLVDQWGGILGVKVDAEGVNI